MVAKADGEIIFFKQRDGPYFPALKLLHKCKLFYTANFLLYLIKRYLLLNLTQPK